MHPTSSLVTSHFTLLAMLAIPIIAGSLTGAPVVDELPSLPSWNVKDCALLAGLVTNKDGENPPENHQKTAGKQLRWQHVATVVLH